MEPRVYLETSVVSYLVARPSRDIVVAAHQQVTREWWASRERYALFTSQLVLREARAGNPDAAARRLEVLDETSVLDISLDADELARVMVVRGAVPAAAIADALHVAIAATNGLTHLLTWNLTHIANADSRGRLEAVCRDEGIAPPLIATPEEMMEDAIDVP
jgi:predicted nucleic acid-binding protein